MAENILQVIGVEAYLGMAILLFSIGILGVLFRRSVIVLLMSIEIMLNAVNLLLVVFSVYHHDSSGQVFVFFSLAVAAAEVAIGLAIIVSIFRNTGIVDIGQLKKLKG